MGFGDKLCRRRLYLTGRKCATDFEVLEVYADHSSPEVNGKGWVTSKIQMMAEKLGRIGTHFAVSGPNQLIYHFEKIYVPSS